MANNLMCFALKKIILVNRERSQNQDKAICQVNLIVTATILDFKYSKNVPCSDQASQRLSCGFSKNVCETTKQEARSYLSNCMY